MRRGEEPCACSHLQPSAAGNVGSPLSLGVKRGSMAYDFHRALLKRCFGCANPSVSASSYSCPEEAQPVSKADRLAFSDCPADAGIIFYFHLQILKCKALSPSRSLPTTLATCQLSPDTIRTLLRTGTDLSLCGLKYDRVLIPYGISSPTG